MDTCLAPFWALPHHVSSSSHGCPFNPAQDVTHNIQSTFLLTSVCSDSPHWADSWWMPSSPCQCFDSLPQIPFTNEHPPNTARCVTPMPCLSSAWIPSSPCTGSVSQCQTSPQGGEWSSYTINLIVLLSSIKSFRASYYLHDNIQTPLSGTKAHLYSGTGLLFMITIANVHLY